MAESIKSFAGCPEWIMKPSCDLFSVATVPCPKETHGELHALGAGRSKLAADDHLTALGTALHDETEHAIAGSSHGQSVQELVSKRFALSDGRETTVLHLGRVERDRVLGELEALLDERGEFPDATSLFAQDFLRVRCTNDWASVRSSLADATRNAH